MPELQKQNRQLSCECNWNAATLWGATYDQALAQFTTALQFAGAKLICYDLPGKGILLVSWKKTNAN